MKQLVGRARQSASGGAAWCPQASSSSPQPGDLWRLRLGLLDAAVQALAIKWCMDFRLDKRVLSVTTFPSNAGRTRIRLLARPSTCRTGGRRRVLRRQILELAPDFDEFCGLLIAHRVDFAIVGAYALAFHGAPGFTGDLDILVAPSETGNSPSSFTNTATSPTVSTNEHKRFAVHRLHDLPPSMRRLILAQWLRAQTLAPDRQL